MIAVAPMVLVVVGLVLSASAIGRRAVVAGRRRPVVRSGPGLGGLGRMSGMTGGLRSRPDRQEGEPIHLLRLRTVVARGGSVLQAFELVGDGDGRWGLGAARVVRRVGAGVRLQDAVDQWATEDAEPSVALVADALAIADATGGSQVRALDAVIDAVRERSALAREVRALASQARASALVLMVMPFAFALAVAAMDPRVRAFYVGTALGPVCVTAGLALDAVGAWWMRRLVEGVS